MIPHGLPAREVDRLVRYALPIVRAWIIDGRMFTKTAAAGRPVIPPHAGLRERLDADVDDVVQDVIIAALQYFEKASGTDRGWSPDGKASLSSYFVGSCVRNFSNVYRAWLRRARIERHELLVAEPPEIAVDNAIAAIDAAELLAMIDEPTRTAVRMRSEGYTHGEIARSLQISPRAVEGRLHRLRRNLLQGTYECGTGLSLSQDNL